MFQNFDAVTIMFCELVGFNSTTVEDAMELVSTMNAVFSCFDSLMDTFNVYKVKDMMMNFLEGFTFFNI